MQQNRHNEACTVIESRVTITGGESHRNHFNKRKYFKLVEAYDFYQIR